MELKDFIGQVVISAATNRRFKVTRITAPEIKVASEKPGTSGYPAHYVYPTVNGDPISTGELVFENPALKEPFQAAFEAYCRTEDARWENYGYWMGRA